MILCMNCWLQSHPTQSEGLWVEAKVQFIKKPNSAEFREEEEMGSNFT